MEILRTVASTSSSALSFANKRTTQSKEEAEDDEEAERIRQRALLQTRAQATTTTDARGHNVQQPRGSFCGQTACGSSVSCSVNSTSDSLSSHSYDDDDREGVLPLPFDPQPSHDGAPHLHNNSWSHCLSRTFKVRSKTYSHDRKKVESGAYLFPARGAELLLTEACPENVARYVL
jgi:hypothetical protein